MSMNYYQRFSGANLRGRSDRTFIGPRVSELGPVPPVLTIGPLLEYYGQEDGDFSVFHEDGAVRIECKYDSWCGTLRYQPTDEEREALARAIWPEGFSE